MSTLKLSTDFEESISHLNLTSEELDVIFTSVDERYEQVCIWDKRKRNRMIFIPEHDLKRIQKVIYYNYLRNEEVHPKVYSYVPGLSLYAHAEAHSCYKYTFKLDLENFFDSITDKDIFSLFSKKHPPVLAQILTRFVCRRGTLPVGSPASPMLSNMVLKPLDEYLDALCNSEGYFYTRYSDDIYVSSNIDIDTEDLINSIEKYLTTSFPNLRVNKKKTHLLAGNNRKITGLCLTQEGKISIGRKRKRELRVLLDKYQKGRLNQEHVSSLSGKLLFLMGHDWEYFDKLACKYPDMLEKIYAPTLYAKQKASIDKADEEPAGKKNDICQQNETVFVPQGTVEFIAQSYLNLGWKILPCFSVVQSSCSCGQNDCRSPGKHPSVKHGVYDATSSLPELLPYIRCGANLAVATGRASGIVVLDIDTQKGGEESYQKILGFINKEELDTLRCNTGGGGFHLYFTYPMTALKNRVGLLPGIDFRTDGGYVLVPPSNHIAGRLYEWDDVSKLGVEGIKPLPESLLEVLRSS